MKHYAAELANLLLEDYRDYEPAEATLKKRQLDTGLYLPTTFFENDSIAKLNNFQELYAAIKNNRDELDAEYDRAENYTWLEIIPHPAQCYRGESVPLRIIVKAIEQIQTKDEYNKFMVNWFWLDEDQIGKSEPDLDDCVVDINGVEADGLENTNDDRLVPNDMLACDIITKALLLKAGRLMEIDAKKHRRYADGMVKRVNGQNNFMEAVGIDDLANFTGKDGNLQHIEHRNTQPDMYDYGMDGSKDPDLSGCSNDIIMNVQDHKDAPGQTHFSKYSIDDTVATDLYDDPKFDADPNISPEQALVDNEAAMKAYKEKKARQARNRNLFNLDGEDSDSSNAAQTLLDLDF